MRKIPPHRHPFFYLVMLAATMATTFLSGLSLSGAEPFSLRWALDALTFPAALLAILMAHEMGHFLNCRRYGIDATLPLFIPGPPFPVGIGTFGAFIRIRTPIRRRHQLLDIGAGGPLAGMLMALPITVIGLMLSHVGPLPTDGMQLQFGESLLFTGLRLLIHGPLPEGHDVFLHPIAMAGWLGFFVTALNLIPAGQLDGGHIMHALFGKRHRYISRAVFVSLVWVGVLGDIHFVSWVQIPLMIAICVWAIILSFKPIRRKLDRNIFIFLLVSQIAMQLTLEIESASGVWLVWGLLVYLFGLDHPPLGDLDRPLDKKRWVIGLLCLVVFIVTFIPLPIKVM